ncbi:MAG TPA: hypothetical protein V6C97_09645 [Oculatellaceae cyanobacterium]
MSNQTDRLPSKMVFMRELLAAELERAGLTLDDIKSQLGVQYPLLLRFLARGSHANVLSPNNIFQICQFLRAGRYECQKNRPR